MASFVTIKTVRQTKVPRPVYAVTVKIAAFEFVPKPGRLASLSIN
jgi:hypothetical protein